MCLSPSSRGDDEVPVSLGDVGLRHVSVLSGGVHILRGHVGDIEPCWVSVPWVTAVMRCPCPSGTLGTSSCDESQSLGLGDIALRRISMSWVGDVEDIGDVGDIEDVGDTGNVRGTGDVGDTGDTEPRCVSVPQVGDIGDTRDIRP